MRHSATITRIALAATFGLAGLAGPARADLPAQSAQRLDAAYTAMTAALTKARPTGAPPRLTDPAFRPALQAMWDAPNLIGTPPYHAKDVQALVNVLVKELDITKAYLFFTADPAQTANPERNTFTYQDEVTRFEVVLTLVFPATLEAVGDLATHLPPAELTPARKQGLATSRGGVVQFMSGWATSVRDANLHDDNRGLLVDSMAKVGPRVAAQMPVSIRQTILTSLKPAVDTLNSAQKAAMAPSLAAFAGTTCEGACAIE